MLSIVYEITRSRENQSARGEIYRSDILSTTNPTWTGLESSPGFLGYIPTTKHLSHLMAPPYVKADENIFRGCLFVR